MFLVLLIWWVQFGSMPRIQDTIIIFLNQVIEKDPFQREPYGDDDVNEVTEGDI